MSVLPNPEHLAPTKLYQLTIHFPVHTEFRLSWHESHHHSVEMQHPSTHCVLPAGHAYYVQPWQLYCHHNQCHITWIWFIRTDARLNTQFRRRCMCRGLFNAKYGTRTKVFLMCIPLGEWYSEQCTVSMVLMECNQMQHVGYDWTWHKTKNANKGRQTAVHSLLPFSRPPSWRWWTIVLGWQ